MYENKNTVILKIKNKDIFRLPLYMYIYRLYIYIDNRFNLWLDISTVT